MKTKRKPLTRSLARSMARTCLECGDRPETDAASWRKRGKATMIKAMNRESLDWYAEEVRRVVGEGAMKELLELRNDRDLFRNAAAHALKLHHRWSREVGATPAHRAYNQVIGEEPGWGGQRVQHTHSAIRDAIEDTMYKRINDLSDRIARAEVEEAQMVALLQLIASEREGRWRPTA